MESEIYSRRQILPKVKIQRGIFQEDTPATTFC